MRPVTAASTASTACSGDSSGNGTRTVATLAPVREADTSAALRQALYSWSVTRISSPDASAGSSERSTALTPAVALLTNTSPASSPPTKPATARRAESSSCWYSPPRKYLVGLASIRLRTRCWASSTTAGVAPNDPWFRCSTPSSSTQGLMAVTGKA